MHKPYFDSIPDGPPSLHHVIVRTIRFEEVDSMGIVWHGRYPGFFEEARVALGHLYGISYRDFIRQRIPVPIRQMTIDYLEPLFFEDEIEIEAMLHWTQAARMNFEYVIRKNDRIMCTGYTIQLMLDDQYNLLLAPPDFYADFMEKWQRGTLM